MSGLKFAVMTDKAQNYLIEELRKKLSPDAKISVIDEEGEIYIEDRKLGIRGYYVWSDLAISNKINLHKYLEMVPIQNKDLETVEDYDDLI